MAEVVVISLAKSALRQLSSPAIKEFLLLWNSRKELQKLEATIEAISHVLEDAQKKQLTDHLVKGWLIWLRSVMYEADDFFDALAATAFHRKTMDGNPFLKQVRLFFSESNQVALLFKIAHDVKDLRESLDAIAKDMGQFSFIKQQIDDKPATLLHREPTHSFIKQKDVIGRDPDRDLIINMLLAEDKEDRFYTQCFSVVAIIGPGGFGKTTLAQLVYNDERVSAEGGFDLCIWVCISYFSDLGKVLKEIMGSVGIEPQNIGLDPLQKKLREIIGGKKYLLVLDDVWDDNTENWHKLKSLLDCGKSGSKVLVTTRSREVARCLDAVKACHQLGVLDEESAWSLFVSMAFDEGELSKHPKLALIGKRIVYKCGYVPLTLRVVGSLLRSKAKDEKTWLQLASNEFGESISDDYDKKITQVLIASYNDLPPNVKLCFAYCSLFPKDYTFDKDELVHLWLSQGFLMPFGSQKQSLEEVGELYFFYLVDRCFFQDVERKVKPSQSAYIGDVRYCSYGYTAKMHHLFHDLAVNVATTESVLIDEVPNDKQKGGILRHISVCSNLDCDYSALASNTKTLRTLLFLCRQKLSTRSLTMMLGSFRMIRTLQLSNSGIEIMPATVGDLIHLRYLNLSENTNLRALPSSICKLHNLMTFVLSGCSSLEKLPSKIGKLVSLRHLYLHECHKLVSLPSGLATLTLLVKLDRLIVHPHGGGLRYLKYLDNLCGALTIELPAQGWTDSIEDANDSKMLRKHNLIEMVIKWIPSVGPAEKMDKDEAKAVLGELHPHANLQYLEILNYCGDVFPGWVCSLQHIKELYLYGCDVEYLEDAVMNTSFFPSLEILTIMKMKNLKGWWRDLIVEDEDRISRLPCLPKVTKVTIQECPLLTERMPLFWEIEYLNLNDVPVELLVELLILNTEYSSPSSFCPYHQKSRLKVMVLFHIVGLSCLPEGWIRHLTSLHTLRITTGFVLGKVSCRGLAHLTALEILKLSFFGPLYVVDEDDETRENQEVGMPWKALQSLRDLTIVAMYLDTNIREGLQHLTSLEKLTFGMWNLPLLDGFEEDKKAIEVVEFPSNALRKLRELKFSCFGMISYCLPMGIEYLHSLENLCIEHCEELYLSWTALLITLKLRYLTFFNVKRVIPAEDIVVEQQRKLYELSIDGGVEWMHDLPWKMLGSLVSLWLMEIGEMEQLPDGIQHLTSLEFLQICGAEVMLTSIPNWMRNLTSLQFFRISGCSEELKQRCQVGSGADWHLISHILCISIQTRGHQ